MLASRNIVTTPMFTLSWPTFAVYFIFFKVFLVWTRSFLIRQRRASSDRTRFLQWKILPSSNSRQKRGTFSEKRKKNKHKREKMNSRAQNFTNLLSMFQGSSPLWKSAVIAPFIYRDQLLRHSFSHRSTLTNQKVSFVVARETQDGLWTRRDLAKT